MPAARRVEGVVAMAWTGRIDLCTGGIRRAAAGRRFVTCAGNEVKKQRSGALRLRRRVCEARCGVAADRAQLKFLRLRFLAPKSAAGAAALAFSRDPRASDALEPRGRRCMFAGEQAADAARHKSGSRGRSSSTKTKAPVKIRPPGSCFDVSFPQYSSKQRIRAAVAAR